MKPLESIREQLPPLDTLTPKRLGEHLFSTFDGHANYAHPSAQLAYLLREYRVYPSHSGDPEFTLTAPKEDGPVEPWKLRPLIDSDDVSANTDSFTPEHPYLFAGSIDYAPHIVTVTHGHHFLIHRIDHDILIAQTQDHELHPFWYRKSDGRSRRDPIDPQPLIDLRSVRRMVTYEPDRWGTGALIEFWRLNRNVYNLQAGLDLKGLSLQDFLRFMTADADMLRSD